MLIIFHGARNFPNFSGFLHGKLRARDCNSTLPCKFKAPDFYAAPRKPSNSSTTFREKPHPERMAQLLDSGPADVVGQSSGKETQKVNFYRLLARFPIEHIHKKYSLDSDL